MKKIHNTVIGVLLGLLLAGGIWLLTRVPQGESIVLDQPPTPVTIRVNVRGAIMRPGVYRLSENSRVADAVEAAGGLAEEADEGGLNLAAHLENGQWLDVPYRAGFVPDIRQEFVVGSENTPIADSASPEESSKLPKIAPTTALSEVSTPSCSDGPVGSGAFVWPAENHYLSGNDYGSEHPGIDIAAGEGSPVYAADSGVVTAKGNDDSGYGNVIQIDHGNGYSTVYAHLSVIQVSVCQGVYAGQLIGKAGNTGNSRGAHLHFEVIKDGWYVDPWLFLP